MSGDYPPSPIFGLVAFSAARQAFGCRTVHPADGAVWVDVRLCCSVEDGESARDNEWVAHVATSGSEFWTSRGATWKDALSKSLTDRWPGWAQGFRQQLAATVAA